MGQTPHALQARLHPHKDITGGELDGFEQRIIGV
jgi:hypothetical protein